MIRLISIFCLIYLLVAVLLVLDNDNRAAAAACGDAPPTETPGPPTATRIPPTASPEIQPTADLNTIPLADAPPGLHEIAACRTRDQVRSMLTLFMDLFEGWNIVPIVQGLPPELILIVFENPADSQRTITLVIAGDDGAPEPGYGASQRIAKEAEDDAAAGARAGIDGELVWMRSEDDGRHYLTWGAVDSARTFTVIADDAADINIMVDALARAAEHACYPDCH